mgnify:CR=1 FL=1
MMSQTDVEPDATADSRGAACPGPLADLVGKACDVEPGSVVRLSSDNEQPLGDVPEWAEAAGNDFVEIAEGENRHEFHAEKA